MKLKTKSEENQRSPAIWKYLTLKLGLLWTDGITAHCLRHLLFHGQTELVSCKRRQPDCLHFSVSRMFLGKDLGFMLLNGQDLSLQCS